MICNELKTVFVHIPKTAGVSVTHAIISHVTGRDTSGEIGHMSNELKHQFSLRGQQKHKQARFFVPEDISKELWNQYYKFAFIRNPWDRAVSEYHWRHSLATRHPPKEFKKFLTHCQNRLTGKEKGIYWTHAQTQKSYVTNKQGKIILDDVFRFEEINDGIKTISENLGIPIEMKKHNTSKHKNYREYYTDETRDIVARLYKEDIEMFNYEF